MTIDESITRVLRTAYADVADEVIEQATNMFGRLGDEPRARLLAVIRDPNPQTWDDAYTLIINGGTWTTLWQAVLKIDPGVQTRASMDATAEERWPHVPDTTTIIMAVYAAAAEIPEKP
jgi:hypothetical protein